MLPTQSRRIGPAVLQADLDAQVALAAMADYKPANAAFTAANITAALTAMQTAQQAELRAQAAMDAARDAAAAAECRFHEAMQGAKTQVVAQYGVNSDQVQSLGLKKKSEHKRPVRQAKAA